VPDLDFALIGEHVRASPDGVANILGAGIDTIIVPQVPTGQLLALVVRLSFGQDELNQPASLKVLFRDSAGNALAEVSGIAHAADLPPGLPPDWRMGVTMPINLAVPLTSYGVFAFDISLEGALLKTIPLLVREPSTP
jgi:hypothetical protein